MQLGFDVPAHWPDNGHPIENLFPELIEQAKRAEKIGFDAFFLAEHHFNDYFVQPSPFALASHLAAVTEKPRIIIAVIVLPLHDVRRLAGEITMTDHLTRGRLEVGFGRGGAQYESDCFGLPFEKARESMEDKLEALLVLLKGRDVSYDGPYAKYPEITVMPPPLQKPHPPLWLSVIRTEAAYHCGLQGYSVQTGALRRPIAVQKELIAAFRKGAAESGSKPGAQKISLSQIVYVAKNDSDVKEKLEMVYANQQRFMSQFITAGIVKGGKVVPIEIDDTIKSLSESVIVGSPEYCIDRLLALKELGYDALSLRMNFGPVHEDIMGSLDRFGEHVMPYLGLGSGAAESNVTERRKASSAG